MRKISFSTWLLVGLAAVTVALSAALLVLTPQEKWNEFRTLHHRYGYEGAWNPAASGDAGNIPSYVHPRNRYRGPHGRPPFLAFIFVLVAAAFVANRFSFFRRRTDASLSILEERFAEGKIDEAEFERKRTVLNGPRGKE